MIHEEESEPDVVKDEVHPVAEADRLLHRLPEQETFSLENEA